MLNYDLSLFNEGVEDLKQDIKRMRSSARKKKKKKYRQFFLEAQKERAVFKWTGGIKTKI